MQLFNSVFLTSATLLLQVHSGPFFVSKLLGGTLRLGRTLPGAVRHQNTPGPNKTKIINKQILRPKYPQSGQKQARPRPSASDIKLDYGGWKPIPVEPPRQSVSSNHLHPVPYPSPVPVGQTVEPPRQSVSSILPLTYPPLPGKTVKPVILPAYTPAPPPAPPPYQLNGGSPDSLPPAPSYQIPDNKLRLVKDVASALDSSDQLFYIYYQDPELDPSYGVKIQSERDAKFLGLDGLDIPLYDYDEAQLYRPEREQSAFPLKSSSSVSFKQRINGKDLGFSYSLGQ